MSEKEIFTLSEERLPQSVILENGFVCGVLYVVSKLNKLTNENEQLKQENGGLKEKLCELGVSDVKINGKRIDTGLEEWLE